MNATLINAIKQLYKNCRSRVKINQTLLVGFLLTKALRQGCYLFPTLFKIYFFHVCYQWWKKCQRIEIPISNDLSLYTLYFAND